MSAQIHIGCSSYYDLNWQGIFYPEDLPKSKWFEYYCQYFDTFEINSTFYKMPTARTLQTWHNKAPQDFVFSVKAPKTITHISKFIDCRQQLDDFYLACKNGLGKKLGPLLFQLPPSYDYTDERLELLCNSLNRDFQNVIEFRHESWWNAIVFEALSANHISFSGVDYPKLPNQVINTEEIIYYRFHGNPRLFYSGYSNEELQRVANDVRANVKSKKAYIYFNNTASTEGILNALQMNTYI